MKQKPQDSSLETYRHSTSHILAYAVKELYPGVKLGIGPAIEDGFYYDFDLSHRFVPEDLANIEKKMQEIINCAYEFVREEYSKEEAIEIFKAKGEKYKVELLQEIKDKQVFFFTSGDFVDLCRGPHVESTGKIKSFKLLRISGAYWRGSEKNPMLQRIYGTAFYKDNELKDYLNKLEEAKKRDHRKIGKELDLFSIQEESGLGLVLWHPKGAVIRRTIEDFWYKEHEKRGYDIVYTPHILKSKLWQKSGHTEFYKENMFPTLKFEDSEEEYTLKPMNCPGHILIYKSSKRSYRELPIRYAELGTVYRYEKSGVLHGLLRVRGFTQDDAHIFCTLEQLKDEISGVVDFVQFMLKSFGLDYFAFLATRPEKFSGSSQDWDKAENTLKEVLEEKKIDYEVDEGAAVFYGPKIDVKIKDALGHFEQGPTIQFDFNLPKKFDVTYVGEDGQEHNVVMVHRVVLGSMERFLGTLIEYYGGAFPIWLSPVQVKVLPISEDILPYAKEVYSQIKSAGIRVEVDSKNATLGYKIREAEKEKTPYIVVLGKNEEKEKTLSVRKRKEGDKGKINIEQFINNIKKEI
ncbi:MAG: threonine--tRNA ligase, partial [Candidatus Omnitrophica bacterium]|nr:threonine--tRNA ligase [Candidatus Omnitrophota bacterium]